MISPKAAWMSPPSSRLSNSMAVNSWFNLLNCYNKNIDFFYKFDCDESRNMNNLYLTYFLSHCAVGTVSFWKNNHFTANDCFIYKIFGHYCWSTTYWWQQTTHFIYFFFVEEFRIVRLQEIKEEIIFLFFSVWKKNSHIQNKNDRWINNCELFILITIVEYIYIYEQWTLQLWMSISMCHFIYNNLWVMNEFKA